MIESKNKAKKPAQSDVNSEDEDSDTNIEQSEEVSDNDLKRKGTTSVT